MPGEAALYQRLHPKFKEHFFLQRIENLVGEGVPDLHLTSRVDGSQHWLELKSVRELPKRESTRVFGDEGLRPEQVAWIHCRAQVWSSVWIFAAAEQHLFLVHGQYARRFNALTLAELGRAAAWKHRGRLTVPAFDGLVSALLSI